MNINDYRRAMDRVVPDQQLKERIMEQKNKTRKYIPVRRAFTGVLAAVLAAACLCTAALAASPELRTAVLSFLRIEEHEQVPSQSLGDGSFDLSQTEIGTLVKAQYIKMDRYYGMSGGLFNDLTWSDDGRTLLSAKFWEVQDSQLLPVEVELNTAVIDITYDGIRYQGELYWFVRDGELNILKGHPHGIDTQPEDEWYVEPIPGRTDAVLLDLAQGRQMEYTQYPVLYHLDTGEAEDLLAGTGAAELEYAYSHLWSQDMRHVLITCAEGTAGQHTWLCSLEEKTCVRLEELTGLDGEVAAGFTDSGTLVVSQYTKAEDGLYQDVTCYAFDLASGQLVKTLDRAPYYRWFDEDPNGAMLFGVRCVLIDPDGQIQVLDLGSGERTVVEGFTFQKGDNFTISPSGDKLLYFATDSEAGGLGITQLGMIDLEQGTFIAFDREGYENLYEEAIGWSDDNTVSINARTPDETRYLLLYQF